MIQTVLQTLLLLPFKILLVLGYTIYYHIFGPASKTQQLPANSKTKVLFTGGRAPCTLEMIRLFAASTVPNFEIHVAESCFFPFALSRFSKHVAHFHTMRTNPNQQPNNEAFKLELIQLCIANRIQLVIPTCEEVFWLSRYKQQVENAVRQVQGLEQFVIFTETLDVMRILHSKWLCNQQIAQMNKQASEQSSSDSVRFRAPKSILITSKLQVQDLFQRLSNSDMKDDTTIATFKSKGFVIKPVYSRFASKVLVFHNSTDLHMDDALANTISSQYPWIAQEFIHGEQLCTYSIVNKHSVRAHTCYIGGLYTSTGKPTSPSIAFVKPKDDTVTMRTLHATQDFLQQFQVYETGQICFDLVQNADDGELYVLECNPRATSGTHLFAGAQELKQDFAKCFLQNTATTVLMPRSSEHHLDAQTTLVMLLQFLLFSNTTMQMHEWLELYKNSKDTLFDWRDWKPFFLGQVVAIVEPMFRMLYLRTTDIGKCFTFDIEWNGEE